jgi:caffeoyl-CoA O-methyltransferase
MADPSSRAGARYATPELLSYLDGLHAPHDDALAWAFTAPERESMPAIQVGAQEGRLIELLVRLCRVRRAVEIGTLAGYSAIRIARGLEQGGRLFTLERDPRHAEVARGSIARAGVGDRVEIVVGDAVERLPDVAAHGPFDLVFLDADKGRYDVYGRWAAQNLRPGGVILADNAYFFGRLLDQDDADAAAMRRFHEEAREAFATVCIPTPDGLLLGIKREA